MSRADCLSPFEAAGILDPLDAELARGLARMAGIPPGDLRLRPDAPWTPPAMVALGAAMASQIPARGHVCLPIADAHRTPVANPDDDPRARDPAPRWPDPSAWLAALRASPLVRVAGSALDTPLVLDAQDRLYLDRYWRFQERLAARIRESLSPHPGPIDAARLRDDLAALFAPDPRRPQHATGVLGQRLAAYLAVRNRFTVISGGPGTGKTTTVTRLLLVLMRQSATPPRIVLAAPTGKAAARLTQAVAASRDGLRAAPPPGLQDPVPDALLDALALQATTIHRLLGVHPDRPGQPRHHRGNPLPADVVVVDEASMVDLALMTRLADAVPADARLILLGDRDQLASVEAGAVLADLCGAGDGGDPPVSPALAREVRDVVDPGLDPASSPDAPPIADAITHLRHPFRYGESGGIDLLARAVREGAVDRTLRLLGLSAGPGDVPAPPASAAPGLPSPARTSQPAPSPASPGPPVRWITLRPGDALDARDGPAACPAGLAVSAPNPADGIDAVRDAIESGWRDVLRDALGRVRDASASGDADRRRAIGRALDDLDRFRVLCTHRRGPRGVETVNRRVRAALADLLGAEGDWYPGRPVMILRNEPALDLSNGDVGLVLPGAGPDDPPLVWFPGPTPDAPRAFPRGQLPPHETVFAMTIHKSQGSQFDRIVVLLPPRDSDFVTRELIYTGLTRARDGVLLAGDPSALPAGLSRRVQRASGLRECLWVPTDRP